MLNLMGFFFLTVSSGHTTTEPTRVNQVTAEQKDAEKTIAEPAAGEQSNREQADNEQTESPSTNQIVDYPIICSCPECHRMVKTRVVIRNVCLTYLSVFLLILIW